jgi:4-oxalocrotonate tautomerase
MARLAADITRAVVTRTGCAERSVPVAVKAVAPEKWTEDAYIPEIRAKADHLTKKPGYDPGA